ncbi:MAG: hypothetical protein KJ999_21215 [Gammaproteobacteria bacterium]|nr:hypothetical protein [Gammaproteobacteria bacterium]
MSDPTNDGAAAHGDGADEVEGFDGAGVAPRYTGVEPERRLPKSNWLSGAFTMIARQAKNLFTATPSYPRSFSWEEKTTLPLPGAQDDVKACVSYAGCLTAAIRHQLQTGQALRLTPRVFHFCTLKLSQDQGTNSDEFGEQAVASGLPYAPSDALAEQAEQLSSGGNCDPFADWPRLRVSELDRFETLEAIKHEISINGPVVAHIALHDGFLDRYVRGTVYRPPAGSQRNGTHAVCLIGYDDDKDYWVGINSSGPGWGSKGVFLLQYGTCDLLGEYMPVYAPRVPPQ